MGSSIYVASDGSNMGREDLICWLSNFKNLNPNCEGWSFDDITGGASNFFDIDDYVYMKLYYEKYLE